MGTGRRTVNLPLKGGAGLGAQAALLVFSINSPTLWILSPHVFKDFQLRPFEVKHKAAYLWEQWGSQPYFKTETYPLIYLYEAI